MKHGDYVTYKKGCRCRPCTNDANRQQKSYKLRVMANGDRPTMFAADLCRDWLRALRAAGYSGPFLAEKMRVDVSQVRRISDGRQTFVWLSTFRAVEQVWAAYRDYPGPDRKAATWAAKRGWLPPEPLPMPAPVDENSVDEVVVSRALRGEWVPLTRAEMTAAWQELERRRMSAGEIGRVLHVAERTIQRWRDDGVATNRRLRADRNGPRRAS